MSEITISELPNEVSNLDEFSGDFVTTKFYNFFFHLDYVENI